MQHSLNLRGRQLNLSTPSVMGILNVTPDSFSDGSQLGKISGGSFTVCLDKVLKQAEKMCAEGAALLDVGGESTRPGADPVDIGDELERVVPVVEALHKNFDIPLSVDTSSPQVMIEACNAGAVLINDIRALSRQGAVEACVASGAAVCLMHSSGEPKSMQNSPRYNNVVDEVLEFLSQSVENTISAGVSRDQILIDPGFGFGKTISHNYQLLGNLRKFQAVGVPILVGLSRKSMIGGVTNKPVDQRLPGSLAGACLALMEGASIIRTHDVAATVDVVKVFTAFSEARKRE